MNNEQSAPSISDGISIDSGLNMRPSHDLQPTSIDKLVGHFDFTTSISLTFFGLKKTLTTTQSLRCGR